MGSENPRPDDWNWVQLGDVVSIVSGATPSTAVPTYWGGDVPWATPTDITSEKSRYLPKTNRSITREGLAGCAAQLLPAGALLLCTRATVGEVKIAGVPITTNQGFKSLICGPSVEPEFLYYLLLTMKRDFETVGSGSTFLEVSRRDVASMSISLPSLAEQRAISKALCDTDDLIEALERLVKKKRDIKRGAMQALLTGEVRLPGFDGQWERRSLLELALGRRELFNDGDWIEAPHIVSSGNRLIQTGNIGIGALLDEGERRHISDGSFEALGCKEVVPGDILICRLAEPAGRACVVPAIGNQRMLTSVDVTIFRPDQDMADRRFLVAAMSTAQWIQAVRDRCGGSTRTRIARSELGKLSIAMPSLSEQQAIATALSDMDAEIEALEARLAKTRAIKQGMMQELLTGRTQFPVTEGAEEVAA